MSFRGSQIAAARPFVPAQTSSAAILSAQDRYVRCAELPSLATGMAIEIGSAICGGRSASRECLGYADHEAFVFRFLSLACPVTRFGPHPAPGGTSPLCFPDSSSQIKFGPLLQNARLGTWEPGPLARLRQGVTRPIREFNKRRPTMYQNALRSSASSATTHHPHRQQRQLHRSLACHQELVQGQEDRRVQLPHRMAPLRRLGQARRVRRRRSRRALICQSKASCAAASTTNKKTDAKQRVWEVRVSSILKLDRAEKASPEEQEHEEINPEEEAA